MNDFNFNLDSDPNRIDKTAFIASNAIVIGEVYVDSQASIWYGAVIRGDACPIWIGKQTNVQDLVCLHGDPGFPCRLGNRVTIGHGAIVHGAELDDDVLIGIRAVVLNGAKIGRHSIIGAGALVPEGKIIPPGSMVFGVPGRVVREVTAEEIAMIEQAAQHYVAASDAHRRLSF